MTQKQISKKQFAGFPLMGMSHADIICGARTQIWYQVLYIPGTVHTVHTGTVLASSTSTTVPGITVAPMTQQLSAAFPFEVNTSSYPIFTTNMTLVQRCCQINTSLDHARPNFFIKQGLAFHYRS